VLRLSCAVQRIKSGSRSAKTFPRPHTAAQQQKLQALPPGKVTLVQKDRMTYYVFPDAANNQAYVGGPTQYQAYKAASFGK